MSFTYYVSMRNSWSTCYCADRRESCDSFPATTLMQNNRRPGKKHPEFVTLQSKRTGDGIGAGVVLTDSAIRMSAAKKVPFWLTTFPAPRRNRQAQCRHRQQSSLDRPVGASTDDPNDQ
jgi:hypothetical protein